MNILYYSLLFVVFNVTFDASLLNKSFNFFKK